LPSVYSTCSRRFLNWNRTNNLLDYSGRSKKSQI